jgi:hypothetical protein
MSDEESPLLSSDGGGGELDDGYGDIGPEPESSKLSEEELKAAGGVVGFRFREMLKVLIPKQDEFIRSDDDAKLESEQMVATFAKHLEGVEHVSVRFPKTIPDSASRLLTKQIRAGKYSALSFVEVGTSTYDKTVFSKPFKSIARKGASRAALFAFPSLGCLSLQGTMPGPWATHARSSWRWLAPRL